MFKIRGKYPGQPWEDIDEFDTRPEALKMLAEYRKGTGRSRGKTYKIGGDLDDREVRMAVPR